MAIRCAPRAGLTASMTWSSRSPQMRAKERRGGESRRGIRLPPLESGEVDGRVAGVGGDPLFEPGNCLAQLGQIGSRELSAVGGVGLTGGKNGGNRGARQNQEFRVRAFADRITEIERHPCSMAAKCIAAEEVFAMDSKRASRVAPSPAGGKLQWDYTLVAGRLVPALSAGQIANAIVPLHKRAVDADSAAAAGYRAVVSFLAPAAAEAGSAVKLAAGH